MYFFKLKITTGNSFAGRCQVTKVISSKFEYKNLTESTNKKLLKKKEI